MEREVWKMRHSKMFPLLHVTLYSKVQYCLNLCQVDFGNFFFPLTIYLYYILIICVPNSTKLKTKFPLEFQSHLIFPLQSPKLFKIVYRLRQYTIQRKKITGFPVPLAWCGSGPPPSLAPSACSFYLSEP